MTLLGGGDRGYRPAGVDRYVLVSHHPSSLLPRAGSHSLVEGPPGGKTTQMDSTCARLQKDREMDEAIWGVCMGGHTHPLAKNTPCVSAFYFPSWSTLKYSSITGLRVHKKRNMAQPFSFTYS